MAPRFRPPGRSGASKTPLLIIVGCAVVILLVAYLVRKPPSSPSPAAQNKAHPVASPTPPADASGYTLFEVGSAGQLGSAGPVSLDVLGVARTVLPDVQAEAYPEQPIAVHGGAAVIENGTAYEITGPTDAPHNLGPADHLFPATTPDLVGVYRAGTNGQPGTAEMVAVTDTVSSQSPVTLPAGWLPFAQASSGFVLGQGQGNNVLIELWQPGAAAGTQPRQWGPARSIVDVSGNEMAWLDATGCDPQGECPLHITNLSTGVTTTASPPPGYSGFLGAGAFSPDNVDTLAMLVYDASTGFAQARLALVQTATGSTAAGTWVGTLLPQAEVTPGKDVAGHVAWTPDGARIMFAGSSGFINEFALGDVQSFPTEAPASFAFTLY